jgi:hypothetical protein
LGDFGMIVSRLHAIQLPVSLFFFTMRARASTLHIIGWTTMRNSARTAWFSQLVSGIFPVASQAGRRDTRRSAHLPILLHASRRANVHSLAFSCFAAIQIEMRK